MKELSSTDEVNMGAVFQLDVKSIVAKYVNLNNMTNAEIKLNDGNTTWKNILKVELNAERSMKQFKRVSL